MSQDTRLGGAELRRFDLNLLVGLHALLYFRNVTRAAEHVGLSQPAMSRELRQLRHLFGDELLVRVGREYRLTTLARELIEPLGQVITSIEGAVARRPSFDPAVETRSFTIGMTDYGLLLLLHPLLQRLGTEAPHMTLHHHPTEADPAEMLNAGRVDLVLEPREYLAPGFPSQVLLEDRWICAVWDGNPEIGESLTPELFERLPRLAFGVGMSGPTSTAALPTSGGWRPSRHDDQQLRAPAVPPARHAFAGTRTGAAGTLAPGCDRDQAAGTTSADPAAGRDHVLECSERRRPGSQVAAQHPG